MSETKPWTRRRAMQLCGAGAACALASPLLGRAGKGRPLGIADLTIKRELQTDYPGTLRQVAALGYREFSFELSGYAGREAGEPTPEEKARYAQAAGLSVRVVGLRVFNSDPDRELDQAAACGAKVAVAPPALPFITGPKRFETTRAAFEAFVPTIATVAEMAKSRGLMLAYHNHWFDHAPLDGESSFDILARQISPELLGFEIDFANAWYAGITPLDLVKRLGPRLVAMHWKDIDKARGGDILSQVTTPGEGDMNYAALLPSVLRATNAPGYVEVDNPADGMAAAASAARLILPLLGQTPPKELR